MATNSTSGSNDGQDDHAGANSPVLPLQRNSNSSAGSQDGSFITISSNLSEHILARRAKAEATKAKMKVVRKEIQLKQKKAEIEAELELLEVEKEMAATEAELRTLEDTGLENDAVDNMSENSGHIFDADSHVKQYVESQSNNVSCLKPEVNNILPSVHKAQPLGYGNPEPIMGDVSRYLLKKELLLSRLTAFNDEPQNYCIWKSSFQGIMDDLRVTPEEELDLLVKWLGHQSSKFAISIRAANTADPRYGLQQIWSRLDEQYGSPEVIDSVFQAKLDNFPAITAKESKRLYELADLLSEINSVKNDPQYSSLLSYLDTSKGINPIVKKLPHSLKEKWTMHAFRYKTDYSVAYPPFVCFVKFVHEMSRIRNDPSFQFEQETDAKPKSMKFANNHQSSNNTKRVLSRKTVTQDSETAVHGCPLHPQSKVAHSLRDCRVFSMKSLDDRRLYLKENNLCFKCLSPHHISRNCKANIECEVCGSDFHCTIMHSYKIVGGKSHGGEAQPQLHTKQNSDTAVPKQVSNVQSRCTNICGDTFSGKSCGKIVLVKVFSNRNPSNNHEIYAVLDDQSTNTLAKSSLLDKLGIQSAFVNYSLTSCSGVSSCKGRMACDLVVESIESKLSFKLPPVLECSTIPDDSSEIPTPEVAHMFKHLHSIRNSIPPLKPDVKIELLIGRDSPELHHVHEQLTGPAKTPFAQKLALGWVIVGEVCLGRMHKPATVVVNKTNTILEGRESIFTPCQNNLCVNKKIHDTEATIEILDNVCDNLGTNVFVRTEHDEKIGFSVEDKEFLKLMNANFQKDDTNHWEAPLPFREPIPKFENNRAQALRRAHSLDSSLKKDKTKQEHFIAFMSKIISCGACEVAPPCLKDETYWYLPLFGVYHPKKKDCIRGVFDSSALHNDMSLNNMLLSGPDLSNSLLGILLRFRKDRYAILADIEQMFYQFRVRQDHRKFLRFFWYKDNSVDNPLIEYQMKVHVFGNSPSPAIATFGLRKTVENSDYDIQHFVKHNFYVDDGVISLPDKDSAVDLLVRTRDELQRSACIKLHKFVSNDRDILAALPKEELAKKLQNVDFGNQTIELPVQSALGLTWNLNNDSFVFDFDFENKPCTRRGILSILNGIYDPIGFLSPITITGKILLREFCPDGKNWDEPLSQTHIPIWENWKRTLREIGTFNVQRMYLSSSLSSTEGVDLHIYCDASEKAISAVAYLVVDNQTSFVFGKSKLAPISGNTIPRLELCSAVLATEIWQLILEHLNYMPFSVKFFTDSKVILGYIRNRTRRFYTYVSNRVEKIHHASSPNQWHYISTCKNPADVGTRCILDEVMPRQQIWIRGNADRLDTKKDDDASDDFPLIHPDEDHEKITHTLGSERFAKFSKWSRLVNAIALLKHCAQGFTKGRDVNSCVGFHICNSKERLEGKRSAELTIIKTVQDEHFSKEKKCLAKGQSIPSNSSVIALSPYLDKHGILRVGGRLNQITDILGIDVTNPIILPSKSHVSNLLVQNFHEMEKHQGRYITESSIRRNGYWIVGARRLVSSIVKKCFTCRKLRARCHEQIMADLPLDRLNPGPPFSAVGVDTFGPWQVTSRKTRGGSASSKRWALIFTCMSTRAIHLEVVEELSSSSFINALRRFMAIRGHVKVFRSDRGTNFVGSSRELKMDTINVEDANVKDYFSGVKTKWIFNAPHSSHMGGSWERLIGISRRILDSMLLGHGTRPLTHEILCTFLAEVSAIVNSRPIANISSDPEDPMVLSPSVLLTQKYGNLQSFSEGLSAKDAYKTNWKQVQILSDAFWKKWRNSYLQSLQQRRKWQKVERNIQKGDIVLMKDNSVLRINWPMGIVLDTLKSKDNLIRKVVLKVNRNNQFVNYTRPISEIVLLLE